MKAISLLSLLAGVTPLVDAHYVFSKLIVNGAPTNDYQYIRHNTNRFEPTYLNAITGPDFRCNQGSMASAGSTGVYTVAPGAQIGFQLAHGATMTHPGPLTIYMSKAPGDVHAYDGSGEWFKVYEEGLCADTSAGIKNSDWCSWHKDTATFTLPQNIPPGQYLVRVEHIGLHRAYSGNTEFYFTCAQIEVTGNGNGAPGPTVQIPGVYQPGDANLNLDIYWPVPTSYNMPGPAVWN